MTDRPNGATSPSRSPLGRDIRPRMADVAEMAKVSHQTVSRVLNDFAGIRPETRQRVLDAIGELGYRRNSAARALVTRRSGMVGIVTADMVNFGPSSTMAAVEQAARQQGFNVSLVSVPEPAPERLQHAFDQLADQRVEAVVVIAWGDAVRQLGSSTRQGVPVVVVQGDRASPAISTAVDHAGGARLATQHLLDLGHRSVVHLAGPPQWLETHARIRGWRQALRTAGTPVPRLRWRGDWSASSGYRLGREIADDGDVSAVFVANDQMALGLLRAMREAGRSVPGDISVVGFDDVPEAEFFAPALTTVRQDFAALGRQAVELVCRAIGGEMSPSLSLIPAELVVRASTAPPGGHSMPR